MVFACNGALSITGDFSPADSTDMPIAMTTVTRKGKWIKFLKVSPILILSCSVNFLELLNSVVVTL